MPGVARQGQQKQAPDSFAWLGVLAPQRPLIEPAPMVPKAGILGILEGSWGAQEVNSDIFGLGFRVV